MDETCNDFMVMEMVTRERGKGVTLVRDVKTGILYTRVEGQRPDSRESGSGARNPAEPQDSEADF